MLPYILSGLFDYYDEIKEAAYETIEECGIELEREKVYNKKFEKRKILNLSNLRRKNSGSKNNSE